MLLQGGPVWRSPSFVIHHISLKYETRGKAQHYRDERERVEVERGFSLAKRKCGMELVITKLRKTTPHVIAMSVLALNLRKI